MTYKLLVLCIEPFCYNLFCKVGKRVYNEDDVFNENIKNSLYPIEIVILPSTCKRRVNSPSLNNNPCPFLISLNPIPQHFIN